MDNKTQQGTIGVTTENIFPIIKKFLYSDHEIFLRELISNAVDATQKMKTFASVGEFKGELGDLTIRVQLDEAARVLTISDHGIGMTGEEVDKYINQIAFSSAEAFMEKYKDRTNIIGHFGLGFYSAFMVADRVEVVTRSWKEGAKTVKWSCEGTPEYTLEEVADRSERGTDIILYISEESREFAEKSRIRELLDKYCKFLPVPIAFGKEEEWKDGKMVATDKELIINSAEPIWIKKPSELTDEDYRNFYRVLYPMAEEPLFHIHLNIDYPFHLTGILYFPKIRNNFEIQKNKIQLYSNQVYVTDSVEGIVPEFLTLLHGVIDSPDIPLNVSRSYLQSDSNVKKISSYITRKVADRLAEIFKNERADFESKWDDLKIFIEYGLVTNEKFAEKAADFVLVKNTEGKYFTLKEYEELVKANQTDKNGTLVYLYTNDTEAQYSFIETARAKGYDVLLMDGQLDNHFIGWVESKNQNLRFARVDADVVEKLIPKEESKNMTLSTAQQEELRPVFEAQLPSSDKANYTVSFEALDENDQPVLITRNEFMRRMKDMAATSGGGMASFYGQMPDSYNVVVNGNHPLVIDTLNQINATIGDELKKFDKKIDGIETQKKTIDDRINDQKPEEVAEEDRQLQEELGKKLTELTDKRTQKLQEAGKENKLVKQMIDLALLSNGMLKGEELTRFIKRSIELIEK
ncbi:MAG: molecular chaperone HtpG [Rikenellaceae bacterium]|jgi:molecular chaperone HtpG|nr:molecular chaperone HtpG [Rikenellaceae bacterium]